jgi:G3E family GTPase
MPRAAIPVTVIAGYLGAGKTTLLNALLRAAGGRRLAVMVNDFGSINIDAELIASTGDANNGIVELADGCICCSVGDDLGFALLDLIERQPPPEHIIIEASGIAEPARVRGFLSMLPRLRVDGTLVLADATRIEQLAGDKQIGPLIATQLAAADLMLLSKSDLTSKGDMARTQNWLQQKFPAARLIEVADGQLPLDVILGSPASQSAPDNSVIHDHDHRAASAGLFTSFEFNSDQPFDRDKLSRFLDSAPPSLLRAKGFLLFGRERETTYLLQLVGARWSLARVRSHQSEANTRLVFIGLAEALDEPALRRALLGALDKNHEM